MTSFRTRLFDTWHPKDERPSRVTLQNYMANYLFRQKRMILCVIKQGQCYRLGLGW